MSKVAKWVDRLSDMWAVLGGVCMLLLTLLITVGVVSRYILVQPLLFTDEFATYLALWALFLALAYSFRVGAHIAVTVVERHFSAKCRSTIRYVGLFIALMFSVIVIAGGMHYWMVAYTKDTVAITVTETPIVFPAVVIPLGGAQMALQFAVQIWRLAGEKSEKS